MHAESRCRATAAAGWALLQCVAGVMQQPDDCMHMGGTVPQPSHSDGQRPPRHTWVLGRPAALCA